MHVDSLDLLTGLAASPAILRTAFMENKLPLVDRDLVRLARALRSPDSSLSVYLKQLALLQIRGEESGENTYFGCHAGI